MPTFSEKTLHQFFQDEIVAACRDLSQSPPPDTQMYLAHLLTRFGRADELFVQMEGRNELEPLPLMLKRALETDDETSRIRILKHLGDVALKTTSSLRYL